MSAITRNSRALLPDWLRSFLPGGRASLPLANLQWYITWKKAIFWVFDSDEEWGALEAQHMSSAIVQAQLRAVQDSIAVDARRVHAAAKGNETREEYYALIVRLVVSSKTM